MFVKHVRLLYNRDDLWSKPVIWDQKSDYNLFVIVVISL